MFISLVIFVLFLAPMSLLIHEVGHIFGAKVKKASKIQLTIGSGKPLGKFSLQNVLIHLRLVYMFGSYTSTIREKPFTRDEKLFITLMGPIFNGILALFLYGTHSIYSENNIILLALLFNVWLFIVNLIPYKFGMKQSDGYLVYQLLFKQGRKEKC